MQNLSGLSPAPPERVEVLFTGPDPTVPLDFAACQGVFLWRATPHVVLVWDGRAFTPLNMTGWYVRFGCQFPMRLKVGHWAIFGPLPRRRSHHQFLAYEITHDTLHWVMRELHPNHIFKENILAGKIAPPVSDQLSGRPCVIDPVTAG